MTRPVGLRPELRVLMSPVRAIPLPPYAFPPPTPPPLFPMIRMPPTRSGLGAIGPLMEVAVPLPPQPTETPLSDMNLVVVASPRVFPRAMPPFPSPVGKSTSAFPSPVGPIVDGVMPVVASVEIRLVLSPSAAAPSPVTVGVVVKVALIRVSFVVLVAT